MNSVAIKKGLINLYILCYEIDIYGTCVATKKGLINLYILCYEIDIYGTRKHLNSSKHYAKYVTESLEIKIGKS